MADDLENVQDIESVPVDAQAVEPEEDMQEPVFNKIQMKQVVDREKQKAYERGKREAMADLQQEQAPQQQAPAQQVSQTVNGIGGMSSMSPAEVQRMIQEHAPQYLEQQMQQMRTNHAVESFVGKMQAAEAQYPGLEKELSELEYDKPGMAQLVSLVNDMPNSAEIMKELVMDNPMKMGGILSLLNSQPRKAAQELHKLSASIKQNDEALAEERQAQDPLSQLKSSTNPGKNSNDLSVKDLRRMLSQR